jgi:DNA-binding response OmpR family regulator
MEARSVTYRVPPDWSELRTSTALAKACCCAADSRPAEEEPGALTFGDLQLLPEQGVLRRLNGDEVHCTRTEFRLLCELAASPNKVLSREQLLDRVWGYDYFGDGRLVDVHIRRLRTKVEADPAVPQHILTVRGMGYKLVP